MNYLFKKEFMSLNKAQLARFVARIAGVKLTNNSPIKKNTPSDPTLYEIKYVDDDKYGYWCINWDWKESNVLEDETITGGYFKWTLKIEPFVVSVRHGNERRRMIGLTFRKQIQKYLIRNCPHFKQAFEETYNFAL